MVDPNAETIPLRCYFTCRGKNSSEKTECLQNCSGNHLWNTTKPPTSHAEELPPPVRKLEKVAMVNHKVTQDPTMEP